MPDEQQLASASLAFETAGEHVLTRVRRASSKSLVEEIRRSLLEGWYDSMTHVAILDGAKLMGVLTIETYGHFCSGEWSILLRDTDSPSTRV